MCSLVSQAGSSKLSSSEFFPSKLISSKLSLSGRSKGGELCMAKQKRWSSTKRMASRKVEVNESLKSKRYL